jgi:hypothetical protein
VESAIDGAMQTASHTVDEKMKQANEYVDKTRTQVEQVSEKL